MTRVIVWGDWHLDSSSPEAIEILMKNSIELIQEHKPDFIVLLGDLLNFHNRIYTLMMNTAYKIIKKMSKLVPVYITVGNHDMISNQQFLTSNHWMVGMKEWHNVTIVDTVIEHTVNDQTFVMMPYVDVQRMEEALNTIGSDKWKNADCIFAHQEIYGAKMGHIVSTQGDKWLDEYPTLISGHLHNEQMPQKNVYYPGSTLQSGFGDNANKSICMLEVGVPDETESNTDKNILYTHNTKITKIKLGIPLKRTVYKSIDNIDEWAPPPDTKDHYRVSLKGTNYSEFKAFKKTNKYKELTKMGIKVVFKKYLEIPTDTSELNSLEKCDKNLFHDTLFKLVKESDDKRLLASYNKLVLPFVN